MWDKAQIRVSHRPAAGGWEMQAKSAHSPPDFGASDVLGVLCVVAAVPRKAPPTPSEFPNRQEFSSFPPSIFRAAGIPGPPSA